MPSSDVRAATLVLAASTVDVVTLLQEWDAVRITNLDTTVANAVAIRFDGTNPVVLGAGCYEIPGGGSRVFDHSISRNPAGVTGGSGATAPVRVAAISIGTPTIVVEGLAGRSFS